MTDASESPRRLALACFVGAVAAAAFVAVPAHPAGRVEFPLDDAWIHMVYVRGIVTEGIPSYNPGVPEAGFSSPLWLLGTLPAVLISRALGVLPVLAVKLTSLASAVLAAWAIGGLARRLGASARGAAFATVAAFVASGLAEASVSGMEVPLALALLALALDAVLGGRHGRAGVLFALALWARPESALATCAVASMTLARSRDVAGARAAVRLLLPSLALGGLWCAYDLAVTGFPLPNTFYAKAGMRSLSENLTTVVRVVTEGGAVRAVLFLGLVALAFASTLASRGDRALVAVAWLAPIAGVVFSRHLSAGAGFCVRRYLHPFVPLGWAFAGVGFDVAHGWLAARTRSSALRLAPLVVCALAALPGLVDARWQHAFNCRDIAIFHTGLARRVAQISAPSTVIGVEGAGASRYFSGRTVIDVLGLNDHVLVHARGRRMQYGCALASLAPDIFVLPLDLAEPLSRVFVFRRLGGVADRTYAQAIPAMDHRVDIYASSVRPEYLARCVARFGGDGSPPGLRSARASAAASPPRR